MFGYLMAEIEIFWACKNNYLFLIQDHCKSLLIEMVIPFVKHIISNRVSGLHLNRYIVQACETSGP